MSKPTVNPMNHPLSPFTTTRWLQVTLEDPVEVTGPVFRLWFVFLSCEHRQAVISDRCLNYATMAVLRERSTADVPHVNSSFFCLVILVLGKSEMRPLWLWLGPQIEIQFSLLLLRIDTSGAAPETIREDLEMVWYRLMNSLDWLYPKCFNIHSYGQNLGELLTLGDVHHAIKRGLY